MPESITFLSEPLLSPEFTQYRVVAPLAERMAEEYSVSILAPAISRAVADRLGAMGVEAVSGGSHFPQARGPKDEVPSFVLSYLKDSLLSVNARRTESLLRGRTSLRVNFSMTNAGPSDLWYVQSRPIGPSLVSILPNLGGVLRTAAGIAAPVVQLIDDHHFRATARRTTRLYTSCRYLADWYRARGFPIAGQVPVHLYPTTFRPTTRRPQRDYALVYLGKETDVDAVLDLIGLGIPLRLFGGKSAEWARTRLGMRLPDHVTMCGYVTHEELMELYTNALITAFPFTDESFGLVPVESMACGTPVLTYHDQGPGETVLDGFTGWLVPGRAEFADAARRIFERGYPSGMQSACVEHSEWFQLDSVAGMWRAVFRACLDGRADPPAAIAPLREAGRRPELFPSRGEFVGPWVAPPQRQLPR